MVEINRKSALGWNTPGVCGSCGQSRSIHTRCESEACRLRTKVLKAERWQRVRLAIPPMTYEEREQKYLRNKESYVRNRAKRILTVKRYSEANPHRVKANFQRWKGERPDLYAASKANYAALEKSAMGACSAGEWRAILKKHDNRCTFIENGKRCHETINLTRDHIVPLSKGGCNFAFNLQPHCRKHNSEKNAKIVPGAYPSLFDRRAISA